MGGSAFFPKGEKPRHHFFLGGVKLGHLFFFMGEIGLFVGIFFQNTLDIYICIYIYLNYPWL